MLRWQHLSLIAVLPFVLASCTLASGDRAGSRALMATTTPAITSSVAPVIATSAGAAAIPPAACPVTQRPNPSFIPPSPYPPVPPPLYAGEFWSGTERLWTMVRADGTWRHLPYANGSYTQKVFWWRRGYDWQTDPEPNLTVTGRRLDAPAPPMRVSRATNGFRDDIGSFMLVGVDIPSLGCWEITGQIAGSSLRFVVWVAP